MAPKTRKILMWALGGFCVLVGGAGLCLLHDSANDIAKELAFLVIGGLFFRG
jgi:hypothetical protein